jgi:hypothetical protein
MVKKTARKNRTKEKLVTYKDLRQLLESEGFVFSIVKSKRTINGEHILFEHRASGAEIRYPIFRPSDRVREGHLVVARMLMDYNGIMDAADFARWLKGPRAFQAA